MFNRLFKNFRKEEPAQPAALVPAVDLSFGYTRFDEFKNYLLKADYKTFESEYANLTWDAKTLLNEGIGLNASMAGAIQKWVSKQPGSIIAHLFAGAAWK